MDFFIAKTRTDSIELLFRQVDGEIKIFGLPVVGMVTGSHYSGCTALRAVGTSGNVRTFCLVVS